jgi:MscS family membrane protein
VIGIRYDDIAKIPAIITEVEAMLKAHKEIDQSQALRVYFN